MSFWKEIIKLWDKIRVQDPQPPYRWAIGPPLRRIPSSVPWAYIPGLRSNPRGRFPTISHTHVIATYFTQLPEILRQRMRRPGARFTALPRNDAHIWTDVKDDNDLNEVRAGEETSLCISCSHRCLPFEDFILLSVCLSFCLSFPSFLFFFLFIHCSPLLLFSSTIVSYFPREKISMTSTVQCIHNCLSWWVGEMNILHQGRGGEHKRNKKRRDRDKRILDVSSFILLIITLLKISPCLPAWLSVFHNYKYILFCSLGPFTRHSLHPSRPLPTSFPPSLNNATMSVFVLTRRDCG